MDENSLTHYGVLGMKWGRRKSKASKGSNVKNSKKSKSTSKKASSVKKKIQNIASKVDKEKVKNIAKASARVAGTIAVTSLLGYTGHIMISEINNLRNEQANLADQRDYYKQEAQEYKMRSVVNADAYRKLKNSK